MSAVRPVKDINWPSTLPKQHQTIHEPLSEIELINLLETTTHSLRTIGGKESWSPLVHSETILNIKHLNRIRSFNGTHIRCEAGITIESIQKYLGLKLTLRGIGTYMSMTAAGAFSTSVSGHFKDSFSDHVTWARTLNAIGESIEWTDGGPNDLFYLRDSMGMLGIVVELEIKVFPNLEYQVFHEKRNIDWYTESDGFYITSNLYMTDTEAVIYHKLDHSERSGSNHYWWLQEWNDFIITPLSYFIPRRWLSRPFGPNDAFQTSRHRQMPYFGSNVLNYRIPLEHCKSFLDKMPPQDGFLRLKYLSPKKACLSHQWPVCEVEIHVPNHKRPIGLIDSALKYKGYTHWGSFIMGNVTKQFETFHCYDQFKVIRKQHDPTGRFMNNYLDGVPGSQFLWFPNRVALWQVCFIVHVVTFVLSYSNCAPLSTGRLARF